PRHDHRLLAPGRGDEQPVQAWRPFTKRREDDFRPRRPADRAEVDGWLKGQSRGSSAAFLQRPDVDAARYRIRLIVDDAGFVRGQAQRVVVAGRYRHPETPALTVEPHQLRAGGCALIREDA